MSTESISLTMPPKRHCVLAGGAPTDKKPRRRGANPGIHAEAKKIATPTPLPPAPLAPGEKKKRKRDIPKKGEEGFLSPTQLRNARKKRKSKQDKIKEGAALLKAETSDQH